MAKRPETTINVFAPEIPIEIAQLVCQSRSDWLLLSGLGDHDFFDRNYCLSKARRSGQCERVTGVETCQQVLQDSITV